MGRLSVSVIIILSIAARVTMAGEAVSGVNGKLDYSGGNMDSFEGRNVSGSVSLPLTPDFGLQVDGLYSRISRRDFYGAGVHLFWRDWDTGLLGVTAATVHEDGIDAFAGGLEAECYFEQLTLAAQAGLTSIEYDVGPVPFIDTDVTGLYAGLELRYYPVEDLMVSGGYDHVFDNELLTARLEYLTPVRGMSVFAEFARGEHDYDHALFGLRFYLGDKKSLQRRRREDDPPSAARRTFYAVGTYGAEYNLNEGAYDEAHDIEHTGGRYGGILTMFRPSKPMTPEEFRRYIEQQSE